MKPIKTSSGKYFDVPPGYCPITGIINYRDMKNKEQEKKKKKEKYQQQKRKAA